MKRTGRVALAAAIAGALVPVATARAAPPTVPRPDHVVIVMLENKRYDAVVGHPKAPWITALAHSSANMLRFYAETHPSQPNYLALFTGSTQAVTDNGCPHDLGNRPNLGRQLIDAGRTFAGYAEDLPRAGWRGCSYRGYVRRHSPWVNFSNLPAAANLPYSAFPADYARLPTVAFVIPNLCHDMHDCPKEQSDAWLRRQFTPYIAWAKTHNSLFVLSFDEDNRTGGNRIATIIAGAGVRPGQYATRSDHYDLLHTLQQMYGLPFTGIAQGRAGIPDIWR
ncbi:alkaline phosphatase family protein [Paractinoplanes globisporus]|uniref:Alkaline phosphatase family protein n=1 Tax=Paractinoplanes globisporus TaxID=113565 RepID=A0ABW6WCK4_9ACTN|nr:alkaline phosphatase family protein [Actinoplanes globisporus]